LQCEQHEGGAGEPRRSWGITQEVRGETRSQETGSRPIQPVGVAIGQGAEVDNCGKKKLRQGLCKGGATVTGLGDQKVNEKQNKTQSRNGRRDFEGGVKKRNKLWEMLSKVSHRAKTPKAE